jgi:hypothetical protein
MLAYLRRRPWLVPCLMVMIIGVSVVVSSRFGYLLFWAGTLAVISGIGMALAGEIGYRRQRTGRQASGADS